MWGESTQVELRGGEQERQQSVRPPSQSSSATQSSVSQRGRGGMAQVEEGARDAAAPWLFSAARHHYRTHCSNVSVGGRTLAV